jgi:predicted ATPase
MAAGLEAAHQSGVAHLDFKSANVMLVGDPGRQQAVITDFGLARNVRQSHEESPREASAFKVIAGTPAYMAPEQVRGEVAGPAADIYSLGIVLYEMVTGVLPFASGTELEVAERRLEGKAPSPRSVVPELDERWEAVIRRCLEREPRRRFARALDVSEALAGYHLAHVSLAGSSQSQHSLPVERDLFVGREVDLAAIERTITGGARLATLLGAAGMGKTRLVIHYGWLKLADWPGGVWFCDLTQARDVNGITSAVGRALGTPLGKGDPVAQLGYALAGRGRCLVILDNLEQTTVAAATTVQQWLERAPKAHFLATSRERLGLASESILQVTPMDLEPGLELFVDRAKRLRPGLELDEAELAAAGEVVHLADGIPLAIELAGARMRVMSAAQILAGMRKRFSLLTGGQSERHETLAVALDGSWELLRPWERAAFAQCSVFEGGFTLAAADSVLDLSSYADAPWPVDAVQALLDKSLLRAWVPETGANPGLPGPRFGMYVSLQEYARGKLATEGAVPQGESGHRAVRAAEDRHGRWYGRFGTEQALAELDRHHGMDKRLALSNEMANFTAATRRGLKRQDGEIATTAYLAAAAASYVRGPFGAVVDLGREVIASPLSRDERALVLAALGGMERESGKMQDGRIHLEAALALHRELGRRRTAGNALNSLGNLHLTQGRSDEARAHYEAALAAHREVGNRLGEGIVLGNLGLLHADQSREEALRFYEAALAIHRENSNRRFEGTVLGYLGNLHLNHGRIDEARAHYEAALGIHREMGNRFNEGTLLGNLGILHHEQGRMQDAQAYFLAALTIHREVGNRRSEGTVLGFLGDLYLEQGLMKEARIHLDAALAIHREVGHRTYEGVITGNLGCLHLGQGRTTEARAHYEVALAIARELGTRREEGIALYYLGNLHFGDGRMEEARANYEAALAIAHEVGDQRGVGLALTVWEIYILVRTASTKRGSNSSPDSPSTANWATGCSRAPSSWDSAT